MKLILMTDFVLTPMLTLVSKKVLDKLEPYQYHNYSHSMNIKYAKFLKQPLELWMFVPCDEGGNVLEEPEENDLNGSFLKMQLNYDKEVKWEIAKERCLFEGLKCIKVKDLYFIERDKKSLFCIGLDKLKKAEDLVQYDLQLTQIAIKQLGL
jgi:hypothetical protein